MNIELISVGTELLLGDIVNTNAQFLSKELASMGFNVYRQTTVGDNAERLKNAFDEAFKRCDIIITTGGLGPTGDDITKETAADYFGKTQVLDEASWEYIQKTIRGYKMGNEVTVNNKKQAMFPKDATIIPNHNGTAPGAIFEKDSKRIIVMPGPPREMKGMFYSGVKGYLQSLKSAVYVSRFIRFFGIGESQLEMRLLDILDKQSNPTVALYAKEGEVMIRVTASSDSEEGCMRLIEPVIEEIRGKVGKYIYLVGDDSVSQTPTELNRVLGAMLVERGLTIATAESCTGGMIVSMLVEYPGISEALLEGIVTYSNESKMKRLGVSEEALRVHGAVSHQTAAEMAEGVAKGLGADIGISTTGVAGPGGGTNEKPVGLVYIGLYYKGKTKTMECRFNGDRNRIRMRAARTAINEARLLIESDMHRFKTVCSR